jgi:methionyl-tRNA formyltransferase
MGINGGGMKTISLKISPRAPIAWENMDVWEIHNFVRAQTRPYPGAFASIDGVTYKIWRDQVFDTRISFPNANYGQVVDKFDEVMIINCRGGCC